MLNAPANSSPSKSSAKTTSPKPVTMGVNVAKGTALGTGVAVLSGAGVKLGTASTLAVTVAGRLGTGLHAKEMQAIPTIRMQATGYWLRAVMFFIQEHQTVSFQLDAGDPPGIQAGPNIST